jgi:hypothetical protein
LTASPTVLQPASPKLAPESRERKRGFADGAAALLTVLVLGVCAVAAPRAEIIDRVLAVVAGDLVLASDVQAVRNLNPGADGLVGSDADILARLIDRALMLAEVDRFAPPEPDTAAVDQAVAAVRARFATPQAFTDALARVGLEERHLRERARQDLRIAAYVSQRFTTLLPSEEALNRYYRENAARFTRNGVLVPFETVRPEVAQAVTAQERSVVVGEWVTGLRRRADIRIIE